MKKFLFSIMAFVCLGTATWAEDTEDAAGEAKQAETTQSARGEDDDQNDQQQESNPWKATTIVLTIALLAVAAYWKKDMLMALLKKNFGSKRPEPLFKPSDKGFEVNLSTLANQNNIKRLSEEGYLEAKQNWQSL